MSDFAPPTGPPPPKGVPEGWKAQWNEQYSEWFYVNIYTKKSQWEKPTVAVYPEGSGDALPPGAPPGYDHKTAQNIGPEKGGAHGSNNPFVATGGGPSPDMSEDEKLARQLQAEEDSRQNPGIAGGTGFRGANDSYYGGQEQQHNQAYGAQSSPYPSQSQELPPRPEERSGSNSKGFLGKLLGKGKQNQQPPYSQQPYGQQPYNQSQGYGGGYPQQGYGPPPGAYGSGYPPQGAYGGGYGGYPQQQQFQQGRKPGGGMGMAGGAALGGVAGLAGGMLLMDAIDDHEDHEQQEAYQDGYQDGQDNDYGGGDDSGGGDF